MRIILLAIIMALFPIVSFAQNEIPNAKVKPLPSNDKGAIQKATPLNNLPAKTEGFTQLEQNTIAHRAQLKEKAAKEQQIYMRYLGVSSSKDPQYAAKKEALLNANPQDYKRFKEEINNLNGKYSKKRLSRAKYNSLTEEQRQVIDNNPDKYDITD